MGGARGSGSHASCRPPRQREPHATHRAAPLFASLDPPTSADAVDLSVESHDGRGGSALCSCLEVLMHGRHLQHLLWVEVRVAAKGEEEEGGKEDRAQGGWAQQGKMGMAQTPSSQQRMAESLAHQRQKGGPCPPPARHAMASSFCPKAKAGDSGTGSSHHSRHDQQLLTAVQLVGCIDLAHGDAHVQECIGLHLQASQAGGRAASWSVG